MIDRQNLPEVVADARRNIRNGSQAGYLTMCKEW
jgi:hypothetical protein